jgi:hypothetical protein
LGSSQDGCMPNATRFSVMPWRWGTHQRIWQRLQDTEQRSCSRPTPNQQGVWFCRVGRALARGSDQDHQLTVPDGDRVRFGVAPILRRQMGIVNGMGLDPDGCGAIRTTAKQCFRKGIAQQEMG